MLYCSKYIKGKKRHCKNLPRIKCTLSQEYYCTLHGKHVNVFIKDDINIKNEIKRRKLMKTNPEILHVEETMDDEDTLPPPLEEFVSPERLQDTLQVIENEIIRIENEIQNFQDQRIDAQIENENFSYYQSSDFFNMFIDGIQESDDEQYLLYLERTMEKEKERNQVLTDVYNRSELLKYGNDCPICLVKIDHNEEMTCKTCNSNYHEQCLRLWFDINKTCPICRV